MHAQCCHCRRCHRAIDRSSFGKEDRCPGKPEMRFALEARLPLNESEIVLNVLCGIRN
jgi:hypothetical protein